MFKKIGDWFKQKKEELSGENIQDIREEADLADKIKITNEGLKEELVEEKEKLEAVLGKERKAKEEAEKQEAERKAKEEVEKQEAARKAREEAEKQEAERKAREEAEKQEAERKAREEVEKQEAERKAKEEVEKQEAERKAREEAEKQEAERKAREEAEKQEAERKAREEVEKQEAERKAKEEVEKQEAERKAREEAEKQEAERKAREEAEKQEAERKAKEEAEKQEAERKAREEAEKQEKPKGFFEKLVDGLDKTRKDMTAKINSVFSSYHKVDEELFEDLEEIMVTADVGINTTMELIDNLRDRVKDERVTEPEVVREMLIEEITKLMASEEIDHRLNIEPSPAIILVVGVNGVGKTTTIGKLSNNLKKDGKKVLVAAGDTFRAAAIEQLEEWGNRANVDIIAHAEGADPAAVIYDGIQAAKARKTDVLICDTAGRLHNKKNLMNELNKIFRVVESEYPEASKEVLLVLDATTGQNAILQAKTFKEVSNITGIALTKLDGTAKGGVVIALQSELGIPVKLVGVGEKIDDLQEFNSEDFVKAIFQ